MKATKNKQEKYEEFFGHSLFSSVSIFALSTDSPKLKSFLIILVGCLLCSILYQSFFGLFWHGLNQ